MSEDMTENTTTTTNNISKTFIYRKPSDETVERLTEVKRVASEFYNLISSLDTDGLAEGREAALARTNLEQAVMWINKGIVFAQEDEAQAA